MIRSTLAILLAAHGVVGSALSERSTTPCTNVHIFVARGNDEPYPGRQGALTDEICSHIKSCDAEHIEYDNPAAPACDALTKGPSLGISMINAYAARCPNTQIVLTGYSQGGQTIGDILGGGGGQFWDCNEPTNAGYDPNSGVGSKIVAALLWGDARHTANQGYNVQSGSGKDGYFPRSGDQLSSLGKWNDRLRSYCVITDPICARGNDGHTHETYFDIYGNDAASWVATKVKNPQAGAPAAANVIQSTPASTLATVVSSAVSSGASSSASGSASGSSSGSTSSSTVAVDAQAVGSSSAAGASSGVQSITAVSSASSTSSAIPWQSTQTMPYFYPVMATNTMPAGTTYSTAPTSIPASVAIAQISATTTPSSSQPSSGFGGNGTYGSATPSVTPFKGAAASITQLSGAIVLVALGAIVAL